MCVVLVLSISYEWPFTLRYERLFIPADISTLGSVYLSKMEVWCHASRWQLTSSEGRNDFG